MRARSHPGQSSRRRRLAVGALTTAVALGAGLVAAPPAQAATTDIQILATNDFHGRILDEGAQAGAAKLAGAVNQLRGANPNTVFAAAGDLIGASTFESFIQNDKPTIDALNAAGLEVSAVGNHELDQGYDDLVNRVMAPYDAEKNPWGGAEWEYIAANLELRATGLPAVPPTWIKDFGDVRVGFVGAVTEDLPSLVSPDGIAEIEVTSIVQSVNAEAARLTNQEGADLVVMLVHEGAPSTACATMDDGGRWADIINNISPDVDAIVSGHTHLSYECSFPVAQWASEGRAVTQRPVVSAGQYGTNLNQLLFTVDGATGVVTAQSYKTLPIAPFPADPAVAAIVADAKVKAAELGNVPLGEIAGPFYRARNLSATGILTDYRGGESTLGNLVAEVQQWATQQPESGAAQIAFMNPGGLRADMVGVGDGPYPKTLTYRQAADVQSFANTLVNMDLTGAQIETILEQQWQRDTRNTVPARPFLRLGVSEGFEYTYTQKQVQEFPLDNPATPEDESVKPYTEWKGSITGMWLDGVPIDPAATYSVSVNSFLASGGDNFREFANGTDKRDTGKVDLAAMVDYMEEFTDSGPLPVDYSQRAVEVAFPADAPASYELGTTVSFDVRSWSMSHPTDVKDTELVVSLGDAKLGSFPVTSVLSTDLYDNQGTAQVSVQLPLDGPVGATSLILTGVSTGTSIEVPITTFDRADSTATGTANKDKSKYGSAVQFTVRVSVEDGVLPTGEVTIYDGSTVLATVTMTEEEEGRIKVKLPTLGRGTHTLHAEYSGSDTVRPSETAPVTVVVW